MSIRFSGPDAGYYSIHQKYQTLLLARAWLQMTLTERDAWTIAMRAVETDFLPQLGFGSSLLLYFTPIGKGRA